ncbi:MAG: tetratricopeptide repeat protein [Gemmatimonadetes bacterium]|nr:tetratricopeptide repeat protein [Gemmatimonadota bacterium]
MSAKLKDQARRHEQREEWQQAIDTYLRVLRPGEEREVADLPLYNRVGDLYLRLGQADDAVRYYEQAATQYAEAGLFNNAIALCNKALRYSPGRLDLLRRLGSYSASQGFLTDARYWFLEFAERAIRKGEIDAAFGALDEFAETSEDPETRELLARRMHAHGREAQAMQEFLKAFAVRRRLGDEAAIQALREEIARLYPDSDLDLDAAAEQHAATHGHRRANRLPTLGDDADDIPTAAGLPGLEATAVADADPAETRALANGRLDGYEHTSLDEPGAGHAGAASGGRTERAGAKDESWGDASSSTVEDPESGDDASPAPLPGFDPTVPAEALEAGAPGAGPVGPADGASWSQTAGANPIGMTTPPAEPSSQGWVDLGDFLGLNEDAPEQTRFFVEEAEPSGDEDRDFAELLTQFKEKLSEHIAHDDVGSHYDLGLAFKEMGLLDEAISQFQIALRGGGNGRLRIYEELGHCFLLKKHYNVAIKVLSRSLQFPHQEEIELIGVYYLLGRAYEETGQRAEALDSYERVVGLDIGFKDVAERIAKL